MTASNSHQLTFLTMFSILSNLHPFRTHEHIHTIYSYFSPKLLFSLPVFLAYSPDISFVLTLFTSLETIATMRLSKKSSFFQVACRRECLQVRIACIVLLDRLLRIYKDFLTFFTPSWRDGLVSQRFFQDNCMIKGQGPNSRPESRWHSLIFGLSGLRLALSTDWFWKQVAGVVPKKARL